jgi:hypothetical protein
MVTPPGTRDHEDGRQRHHDHPVIDKIGDDRGRVRIVLDHGVDVVVEFIEDN